MTDFTPTPEQLEAAAKTLNDNGWTCEFGAHEPGHYYDCMRCRKECDGLARAALVAAALVAAQGAALQTESDDLPTPGKRDNGNCGGCRDLGPHRNVPGCRFYEAPVVVEAKLPHVTRLTLLGLHGARSAEHWDYAGVELSVQDDGRTLKVFPLQGGAR